MGAIPLIRRGLERKEHGPARVTFALLEGRATSSRVTIVSNMLDEMELLLDWSLW